MGIRKNTPTVTRRSRRSLPRRVTPLKEQAVIDSTNGAEEQERSSKRAVVVKAGKTKAKVDRRRAGKIPLPKKGKQLQYRMGVMALALCLHLAYHHQGTLLQWHSSSSDENGAETSIPAVRKLFQRATRSLAQVPEHSAFSWIHQRSDLIDWEQVQTSYDGIVQDIQTGTSTIANATGMLLQDVGAILAVTSIAAARSIGTASTVLVSSSQTALQQVQVSSKHALVYSVQALDVATTALASKLQQLYHSIPSMPNSGIQILPSTSLKKVTVPKNVGLPRLLLPRKHEKEVSEDVPGLMQRISSSTGLSMMVASAPPPVPSPPPPSNLLQRISNASASFKASPIPVPAPRPQRLRIATPKIDDSTTTTTRVLPSPQKVLQRTTQAIQEASTTTPQEKFQIWARRIQAANVASQHYPITPSP